jgi:hypothetical protein
MKSDLLSHDYRIPFVAALIAVTIGGCASNAGGYKDPRAVEARLTGMSEAEVVQTLGAPQNEVALPDRKTWTYSDDLRALNGGSCRVSLTLQNGRVQSAIVNASDYSWVAYPLGSCRNILGHLK